MVRNGAQVSAALLVSSGLAEPLTSSSLLSGLTLFGSEGSIIPIPGRLANELCVERICLVADQNRTTKEVMRDDEGV